MKTVLTRTFPRRLCIRNDIGRFPGLPNLSLSSHPPRLRRGRDSDVRAFRDVHVRKASPAVNRRKEDYSCGAASDLSRLRVMHYVGQDARNSLFIPSIWTGLQHQLWKRTNCFDTI